MPGNRIFNGIIRDAKPDDARFLSKNNEYMAMETENRHLDPDIVARGVSILLNNPGRGRYLIAEYEGKPIGQCMITYEWSDWRCGDFWWIQSVYIEPEFRRKGVFTAMYSHIMNMADKSDLVAGVRLYVEKENIPAQQTYLKLGLNHAPYTMFESDFCMKQEEETVCTRQ